MTTPILIAPVAHRCVECSFAIPAGTHEAVTDLGFVHPLCLPEGDS